MLDDPQQEKLQLKQVAKMMLGFIIGLWLIMLVDDYYHLTLFRYGVYPQQWGNLWGVLWAPLIHGSWTHLFSNTLPLFILGTGLFYNYPKSAKIMLPVIYLGSGLLVWLFARPAYHIGASSLTYGMMFFIFVMGILRRDKSAIALSLLVFFLYGSMIWGIFPHDPTVSYEYHLYAAMLGVVMAFVLRHVDPKPPVKHYDWEDEDS